MNMMNFLNNPHEPGPSEGREPAVPWPEAARIGFAALAAALFWFQPALLTRHLHLSGWVAIAIAGYPMLREAALNLRERRMTMELSMTLALACAAAIGEFLTALVITLFVLVAEVLEGLTVGRGRRAIEDLLDVLPRSVTARRDGASVAIQLGDLQRGEVVLVNPGGRLPVDGTVVGGNSFVDESVITGEPMPVEKHTGAWGHAGSINQSGALDVRVERIGRDTAFGRIVTAVEQAEQSRAPIQKLADQLAGYLVYFALACAAGTWLVTRDLRSTISVIIVAGACGIAAGTPLAVLGAIGRAARLGAIVKGGIFLEALGRVDTVVLDKTGTLTFGTPEVVAIEAMAGYSREQVLAWAALAEGRSEHPLGGAILRQAEAEGLSWEEPAQFVSVPGRGVSARGAMGLVLAGNRDHLAANGVQVEGALAQDHPAAGSVPGWWANYYFGPGAVVNSSADADGDGYSNYAEYVFGTNPGDPASYLNFSVVPGPGGVVSVTFSPWQGGRAYQLQAATDLSTGAWVTLTNSVSVNTNGDGVFTLTQPNSGGSFYRLSAQILSQ